MDRASEEIWDAIRARLSKTDPQIMVFSANPEANCPNSFKDHFIDSRMLAIKPRWGMKTYTSGKEE